MNIMSECRLVGMVQLNLNRVAINSECQMSIVILTCNVEGISRHIVGGRLTNIFCVVIAKVARYVLPIKIRVKC